MYAKVFVQIFDSSIADNWKHRHVFEDLLKLADKEGFVDMTIESIVARTRLPRKMVKDAITALMEPDIKSRTNLFDGRRLIKIDDHRDWGWKIVNYEKYRNLKSNTDRTEYMRKYMQEYRKSEDVLTGDVNKSLPSANSASAYVSSVQGKEGVGERGDEFPHGFPETIEDAINQSMMNGVDPKFITTLWNTAMSRNGHDGAGQPIASWRYYVAKHWPKEQEKRFKQKKQINNGQPNY